MRWDWVGALDWEFAKTISGSRVVTLAAFFPFIGYLALLNTEIVGHLSLYLDANDELYSSTLDRIEEIYFALFLISFGVIIFHIWCPHEIKQFRNRYEMVDSEMQVASPIRLEAIRSDLLMQVNRFWVPEQLRAEILSLGKDALEDKTSSDGDVFGYASGNPSRQDYLSTVGNSAVTLLNVFYDFKRQSRPIARFVSLAFVLVGYIKLSVPSAKVFWALVTT